MPHSRTRYTAVAFTLHWVIAAAIVFQIILGWRMGWGPKGPATYALFQLHKSVGITILLLSLGRIIWRVMNPAPPAPVGQPKWEKIASHIVHGAFYLIMLGLPITGWLIVSSSKTNIPTLLYGAIPWPHVPGVAELPGASKHVWNLAASTSHELLVKLTYALLALHLGAVAKHQILDRDEVFSHMAAGAKPGWGEPRAWLAAAVLAGVIAAGFLFTPSVKLAPAIAAVPAPAPAPPIATPAPALPAPMVANTVADAAPKPEVPTPPAAWTIDKTSTLGFSTAWSGQAIEGRFKTWDGDILFSPDALDQSKLTIRVQIASAATGDDQRDSTLPTDDWFSAATHPTATFTASRFTKTGPTQYMAYGTLSLRGVSRPVHVAFTLKIKGDAATAMGEADVDRTVFGVGQGEWAATDQIPAKVRVRFAITATKEISR
jgi:cytochrome b561/polyisoprenoid-binding protein YceI